MDNNSSRISKMDLQYFCLFIFCIALVYSKYMLSVSFFALGLLTLIDLSPKVRPFIKFNKQFIPELKAFFLHPAFVSISLILIGTLISGINSEDTVEWLKLVRRKTPYLALPIILFMMPVFSLRSFRNFIYFFLVLMWISAIGVFTNYLIHYDLFNFQIGFGQPIPTPIAHNIYSLFLCFAAVSGIVLLKEGHHFLYKQEKYLILIGTSFIIVLIHLLSVRSGLVAFYICFFLFVLKYLLQLKKIRYALIIVPLLMIIPYLAITYIPSLNSKFYYTMHDISLWKSGQGNTYSDSGRLQSMEIGLKLWKENKMLGTGLGDLKQETLLLAEQLYGNSYRGLKPHNQWIYLLAGSGLLGTFIFSLGFFIPILYKKAYKNEFLFYFILIILLSTLVESSLERSYSIGFHLYFLLLSLKTVDSNVPGI